MRLMRILIALGVAAVVAATVTSSTSAGPPAPQAPYLIGTSSSRPVAGKRFTGITVGYIATTIGSVVCYGRLGHRSLREHEQLFDGPTGTIAATCSWQIPRSATGKHLHVWAQVFTPDGELQRSGLSSWRVR